MEGEVIRFIKRLPLSRAFKEQLIEEFEGASYVDEIKEELYDEITCAISSDIFDH